MSNDEEDKVLDQVSTEFNSTLNEIKELEETKKPLTKKINKHKSGIKKIMKRKLEEIQSREPDVTDVDMKVGNTVFTLEQVTSCAACKVENMDAFFEPENIKKYQDVMEKKRLKITWK